MQIIEKQGYIGFSTTQIRVTIAIIHPVGRNLSGKDRDHSGKDRDHSGKNRDQSHSMSQQFGKKSRSVT